MPCDLVTDANLCGANEGSVASSTMDQIDRAILNHLQEDGRLTNVELAERVRLSPSPCLRRVRTLEAEGMIQGYRAVLDPAQLGRGFQVFVAVELIRTDHDTILAFEEAVAQVTDVIECHSMFGRPDYILRVAVNDIAAYEALVRHTLSSLPGVGQMTSQIALKAIKPGGTLPV